MILIKLLFDYTSHCFVVLQNCHGLPQLESESHLMTLTGSLPLEAMDRLTSTHSEFELPSIPVNLSKHWPQV